MGSQCSRVWREPCGYMPHVSISKILMPIPSCSPPLPHEKIAGWGSGWKNSLEHGHVCCLLPSRLLWSRSAPGSSSESFPPRSSCHVVFALPLDFTRDGSVPTRAEWFQNMDFELGIHDVNSLLQILSAY